MIALRTFDEAMPNRTVIDPGKARTNFIGRLGHLDDGPQAFLVENPPHEVIEPHFHNVCQYQIVLAGDGRLGKKPIRPGSLHYVDEQTPYGPIVAGDGGLSFFTLRQRASVGASFMPGSRKLMTRKAGRNLIGEVDLDGPLEQGARKLFGADDGVLAYSLSATPGANLPEPDDARTGGAFLIVLKGSLRAMDKLCGRGSCLFISSDEWPDVSAGVDGAVAALMAFSRTA